jgi:hypothetical protein
VEMVERIDREGHRPHLGRSSLVDVRWVVLACADRLKLIKRELDGAAEIGPKPINCAHPWHTLAKHRPL